MTVELTEHGEGTLLELTHEGFATPDAREGHEQGWTEALHRLVERLVV